MSKTAKLPPAANINNMIKFYHIQMPYLAIFSSLQLFEDINPRDKMVLYNRASFYLFCVLLRLGLMFLFVIPALIFVNVNAESALY